MPTIQLYKGGTKVVEHIAAEGAIDALEKVCLGPGRPRKGFNAKYLFMGTSDRLPDQFCRLLDRIPDHLALQWGCDAPRLSFWLLSIPQTRSMHNGIRIDRCSMWLLPLASIALRRSAPSCRTSA